jgi:hypothetical protein
MNALYPLIGYEAKHGPAQKGWAEGLDLDELTEEGRQVMEDWEDEYWRVEKEGEKKGWEMVGRVPEPVT